MISIDQLTETIRQTFPDQMRDCMELSGLRQMDLAEMMSIRASTISAWMNGTAVPKTTVAIALARCLGVSVELLMTGEEL